MIKNSTGSYLILSFSFIFFLESCGNGVQKTSEKPSSDENVLKGKWRLVSRKFDPDTVFIPISDTIVYHKIITDKTFVWYTYDASTKDIIQMAGGTYRLEGESYTEVVEFDHIPGTGISNSSIPFKCEVDDGKWHHSGYINEREFDEELDDYVIVAERRLEEIWERIE